MKKIISLILAATLGLSLSACSTGAKSGKDAKAEKIKIRWYGVCSFEIIINGKHIVTDPYITLHERNKGLTYKNIEDCETVLISHGHYDHITDLPDIVKKWSPRILAGTLTADPIAEYSNSVPADVYPVNPGLELDFGSYKIKAMFGRHSRSKDRPYDAAEAAIDSGNTSKIDTSECFRRLQTLGNIEYTNYIITAGKQKVVVFGGQPTTEMANLFKDVKPDVAFVQLYGQDVGKVAKLCREMGAKNVVPAHLDFSADRGKYITCVNELKAELKKDGINVVEPFYNDWMEF